MSRYLRTLGSAPWRLLPDDRARRRPGTAPAARRAGSVRLPERDAGRGDGGVAADRLHPARADAVARRRSLHRGPARRRRDRGPRLSWVWTTPSCWVTAGAGSSRRRWRWSTPTGSEGSCSSTCWASTVTAGPPSSRQRWARGHRRSHGAARRSWTRGRWQARARRRTPWSPCDWSGRRTSPTRRPRRRCRRTSGCSIPLLQPDQRRHRRAAHRRRPARPRRGVRPTGRGPARPRQPHAGRGGHRDGRLLPAGPRHRPRAAPATSRGWSSRAVSREALDRLAARL